MAYRPVLPRVQALFRALIIASTQAAVDRIAFWGVIGWRCKMKWVAYCKVCRKFLAHSGPNESAVLVSAREHMYRHASKKRRSVAIGLCSYFGGRFIFTPFRTMRLARKPGALAYYPRVPEETTSMRLSNDEEDQGNFWDNVVRAFEEDR